MNAVEIEEADRQAISALAEERHSENVFGQLPYSEEKFDKLFDGCLSQPQRFLSLKASIDDKPVGFVYCLLGDYFLADDGLIASVNVLCVGTAIRGTLAGGKVAAKLVGGVKKWAKANDAFKVTFYVTDGAGATRADKFFRKLGMQTLGGNYAVSL